jgi:hypothetical protein
VAVEGSRRQAGSRVQEGLGTYDCACGVLLPTDAQLTRVVSLSFLFMPLVATR